VVSAKWFGIRHWLRTAFSDASIVRDQDRFDPDDVGNGGIHIVRAMLEGRITSAGPCPAVKLSSILGCEPDMFPQEKLRLVF
jgi:hypothetical protein